ncbi:hypothetical protein H2203_004307 [Taxawa tesnikishii (nom. ined.)]|nr:hypothetical protein H2203_004307 [Dothideales sp. JES 119]
MPESPSQSMNDGALRRSKRSINLKVLSLSDEECISSRVSSSTSSCSSQQQEEIVLLGPRSLQQQKEQESGAHNERLKEMKVLKLVTEKTKKDRNKMPSSSELRARYQEKKTEFMESGNGQWLMRRMAQAHQKRTVGFQGMDAELRRSYRFERMDEDMEKT